jgi:hypothetical protein
LNGARGSGGLGKISARDAKRRHRRSHELVRSLSLIILDSEKRQ